MRTPVIIIKQMKQKRNILLLLAGCILLIISGCKKDENSIPLVWVSPSDININAQQGDIKIFEINADGGNDELVKFTIHTQVENQAKYTVLDTTINIKKFNYTYQYVVPDTITGSVFITYTAYDKDGEIGQSATRIIVSAVSTLLTEYAGSAIFSKYSGKHDAFDINTNTVQFSATAAANLLDIADYDTIQNDSTLSLQWHSPAGNKFVLFNGYDYANATDLSVASAYNSGQKLDIISNLSVNDIIITKEGSGIYAVIKITNIVDSASTINDRYEFNIKK